MSSVRHWACPVSPGWTVGSTLLQSVTVKGEVGSFMMVILGRRRQCRYYRMLSR